MRPSVDLAKLADELEREGETPLLGSLFRFVNRPGNAVRAILAGDPGAAARNVAQMALDFPTGGFLDRRASLANILGLSETGDITSARDRYTTEDVLRAQGLPTPVSPAEKFAVGFAGDTLTDPLTYATLGTGSVGKLALRGLSREAAAASLAEALGGTAKGKDLLARLPRLERAAGVEDAIAPARFGGVPQGLREQVEALRARVAAAAPELAAPLERPAPDLATELERVLALPAGRLGSLTRAQEAELFGQLRGQELLPPRSLLDRAADFTAPALAVRGIEAAAPAIAKLSPALGEKAGHLGETLAKAGEDLAATFYDKTLSGVVPRSVQRAADEATAIERLRAGEGQAAAREITGLVDEATQRLLGRRFLAARDAWVERAAPKTGAERRAIEAELQAALEEGLAPRAVAAARRWMTEVQRAQKELAEAGLEVAPNPFHVPRQLRDEVARAMPTGAAGLFRPERKGVQGVLTRRAEYPTAEAWLEGVAKTLREAGADSDETARLLEQARKLPAEDLAETHLGKLALRYADDHARTLGRAHLDRAAKQVGARPGDAVDQYVQRQWASTGGSPGAIRRAIKLTNRYFKPAATVIWPSYHVRNLLAATVQTALDPDLSLADGVRALWQTVRNGRAIALREKLGLESDQALILMRAADADPEALRLVEGMTIAGRSGKEVLRGLTLAASRAGGEADLFESASTLQRIGLPVPGRQGLGRVLDGGAAVVDLAYKAANLAENTMRTHNYLALLAKGVDPIAAGKRVSRAFVDYNVQSAADGVLRDLVPFARYGIAVTPPTVEAFLRRPGGVVPQLLRQAEVQKERQPEEDRVSLPDYLRRGFGLPLGGGDQLGSLGLPQEAAAQLLEAIPTPGRGFAGAQRFLGGLAPLAKLPIEATADRNFFSGREWGTDRRSPFGLPVPGFLGGRTILTEERGELHEVPGWVNELMRALPTSRFASTVDSLLDEDKSALDKIVRTLTGVNVVRPEQRRATARALATYFRRLERQGRVGEARRYWPRIAEGEELPEGLKAALEAELALKAKRKAKGS